jgi:hypothetical protein
MIIYILKDRKLKLIPAVYKVKTFQTMGENPSTISTCIDWLHTRITFIRKMKPTTT